MSPNSSDICNPTYDRVQKGDTGHIQVFNGYFNPKKISYEKLVKHFFSFHDPTQKNGFGYIVGP